MQSYKGGKKRDEKQMAKEDSKFIGNHSAGYSAKTQAESSDSPFVKNFYKESESITNRPESENAEFLKTNHISVSGADIPRPIMSFEESGLPKHILAKFKEVGYEKPSPI